MTTSERKEIDYIKELYDKKDTAIKPDVRRVIRLYNQIMPDGKHIFHAVSEQICACSLRPYLLQLYRKLESMGYYTEVEKPVVKKPAENKKTTKKGGKAK